MLTKTIRAVKAVASYLVARHKAYAQAHARSQYLKGYDQTALALSNGTCTAERAYAATDHPDALDFFCEHYDAGVRAACYDYEAEAVGEPLVVINTSLLCSGSLPAHNGSKKTELA